MEQQDEGVGDRVPKAPNQKMIAKPGRFLFSACCRCGKCEAEAFVQVTAILAKGAVTPDADVPGEHTVLAIKDLQLPEGWTVSPELEPRCPKHSADQMAKDLEDLLIEPDRDEHP